MTPFQLIACTALGAVTLLEVLRLRRGSWRLGVVRVAVWAAALVAIAAPDLATGLAHALGIGRGADVVLYLFVLAFIATAFAFHARQVRTDRELSALVEHLAVRDARRGGARPTSPDAPATAPGGAEG